MLDFSFLQKIIAALKMLACSVTTDLMDEYLKIEEATLKGLKLFVKPIISIFPKE